MKLHTTLTALGLFALSAVAFAGSEVKDSTITNLSNVNQSANLAIGKGAEANMGTVKIQDSKVEKSKITNLSNVNQSANLAIGEKAEANMGSVVIK